MLANNEIQAARWRGASIGPPKWLGGRGSVLNSRMWPPYLPTTAARSIFSSTRPVG